MKALLAGVMMGFLLSACSYSVQPVSTRAINIYSTYDDKIPGNYALVLDDSVRNVQREISPTTSMPRS